VKTEIDFLRELEADLDRAARMAPAGHPRARRPTVIARHPSRRVLAMAAVAFLLLAGTIGYFLRSGTGDSESRIVAGPAGAAGQAGWFGASQSSQRVHAEARLQSQKNVSTQPDIPAGQPPPSSQGGISLVRPQIVKTGQLSLEVAKGHFDEAFRQASLVASRYGGFVDSSSSRGSESKSGTLEIRVPSLSFDRAVGDLASLGTVLSQSVDATDVTAQYVDLQARVRTWQAQEDVLIKLMAEATTLQDTLRVQNELQDVQLQIERLQGQLRVLDDQTANATISVSLREAGAPVTKPEQTSSWLPSFRNAWHDAVRGLLSFLFAVMVGLAYLVPAALLVLLGWLGYQQVRLRTSG
jgi:Domain of unknown function (DUF4349)